jgi:hypothetical protein
VAIGRNLPRWQKANVSTGGPSFTLYHKNGQPVLKKTWKEERFRAFEIRKKAWRNLICTTKLTSKGYGESETSVLLRFWGSLDDDRLIIHKMQSERVPVCAAFDAGHKFQFSRQQPAPTTKVALVIWKTNIKKGVPEDDL